MDPVSLPPRPGSFDTGHPGIFRVFEDSLPDDWGRKILVRKHRLPRQRQNLPSLLLTLGNSGLGALSYTGHGKPNPPASDTSAIYLSDLVTSAEAFERGEIDDLELTLLFGAASSPGGARPKALVFDDTDKIHYLAKFPSIKDAVNVVRIEAATMALAARAGLIVPHTRLVECGKRDVLLVERFDIINATARRHMISLQTLLKAHGYYQCRYIELLNVVRKYSSDPQSDSELLYRQMVFNAVVGNTDDHLKNFWMVFSHDEGWRLSPAIDLVPDVGRRNEHVLFFDLGGYYPGRHSLEKLGRTWGISNSQTIVEQVFDAVSCWRTVYSETGVNEVDIKQFKEIDIHLSS